MKKIYFVLLGMLFVLGCSAGTTIVQKSETSGLDSEEESTEEIIKLEKKMKAIIETSMGNIEVELFAEESPITVENFVGLAEGKKEFIDPKTGEKTKRRFYDGLTFHRVIPEFMIQGGCPLGTGTGGPGYRFQDETDNGLAFDKPGLLAMANAGPNTNGSQFFITEVKTPWLTGHHTIFGQVVSSKDLEVVKKIARVDADLSDKPLDDVIIKKITIK